MDFWENVFNYVSIPLHFIQEASSFLRLLIFLTNVSLPIIVNQMVSRPLHHLKRTQVKGAFALFFCVSYPKTKHAFAHFTSGTYTQAEAYHLAR